MVTPKAPAKLELSFAKLAFGFQVYWTPMSNFRGTSNVDQFEMFAI
jgi:hypothetical protein